MKELQEILSGILPVVRKAGEYVRTAVPQSVDEKSGHTDLVTEFDVNTQRMLTEALAKVNPEAVFMGEEEHLSADVTKGDCFVIDPIDGTTNFVMGYRHSGISVALLRNGVPVIGVVYNPWLDEMYSAVQGEGSFCNGKPLHASEKSLRDSVINFGTAVYRPELAQRTMRIAARILETAVDVRRLGSASLDLCDAAAGRCGAFFELRLSPWDYAAGGLIVTEAGGVVTDALGGAVSMEHPCSVVAGGRAACADLLRILAETN